MDEQDALTILRSMGAIITNGHFVFTSGMHGATYVNKDAVYPHTEETSLLCRALAERFANNDVEVVIAPAIGGAILSQWIAHHLTELSGCKVLAVYAEKSGEEDAFVIKRGYDKLIAGRRVLAVEDVLNTGDSTKKVVEATQAIGGNVIGLGVLFSRGGGTIMLRNASLLKITALVSMKLDAWGETDCPRCAQNVPINTNVGKGREFLARRQP